jgi:hypothetical protein
MAFVRQFLVPVFILLIFVLALVTTSARIFLPDGLSAPASMEEVAPPEKSASVGVLMPSTVSELPPSLSIWVNGVSDELAF